MAGLSGAAWPPDVREGSAFPGMNLICSFRGYASKRGGTASREWNYPPAGKAEPFRTSGGEAGSEGNFLFGNDSFRSLSPP